MMICGQFFHASQTVLEEWILKSRGGQEPWFMMGWEGIWGFTVTGMLILGFTNSPCPFATEDQCVNDKLEDVTQAV